MSKQQVRVRLAARSDADTLARIGAQTFAETFERHNTPEDMAAYLAASFSPEIQGAQLEEPGSIFLIAEIDGQIAGYVRLRDRVGPPGAAGPLPIELSRLYALEKWIGHGVGATLMRACVDEARARGCQTIWLNVWEHNDRAIRFYERWGFRTVGTTTFTLGSDDQTDLLMELAVASVPED